MVIFVDLQYYLCWSRWVGLKHPNFKPCINSSFYTQYQKEIKEKKYLLASITFICQITRAKAQKHNLRPVPQKMDSSSYIDLVVSWVILVWIIEQSDIFFSVDYLFNEASAEVSQTSSYINSIFHKAIFGFIDDSANEFVSLHTLVPPLDMNL